MTGSCDVFCRGAEFHADDDLVDHCAGIGSDDVSPQDLIGACIAEEQRSKLEALSQQVEA